MAFKNGIDVSFNDGQPYGWSQNIQNLTVTIFLSPPLSSVKELNVEIKLNALKVTRKIGNEQVVLIEGNTFKQVCVDDSTWFVEQKERLIIELMKSNRMEWWNSVIVGHKEVDPTKLQPEPSTNLQDLDSETQTLVRKMMFDARQKEMGLPGSDELQKRDMLKKFAEQHPELDFSNVKIQ